uniref:Uncharacterized protein n=1 Tax=Spongospora subterranea TaxID=70186 RepID=A0A0H5RCE6_9EUKA|eukprot:CRZ11703.1 hypothetical protein [Spongospora subterranea]
MAGPGTETDRTNQLGLALEPPPAAGCFLAEKPRSEFSSDPMSRCRCYRFLVEVHGGGPAAASTTSHGNPTLSMGVCNSERKARTDAVERRRHDIRPEGSGQFFKRELRQIGRRHRG